LFLTAVFIMRRTLSRAASRDFMAAVKSSLILSRSRITALLGMTNTLLIFYSSFVIRHSSFVPAL
jgi:hypothetical protein